MLMKAGRGTALVVAGLLLLAPPAMAQSRAELQKVVQRKVLPNGLEVIVIESHGVPIVTLEIDVKNGSFTQTPEYAGLAHMYEHMFFKSNKTFATPESFNDRAAELGAVYNGTTQEERVNYYLTVPTDSAEGALRFLAAALRDPLFRKDELERERQVVIGEYDRNESSPFFHLTQAMTERLYPGQWSRKNTIGDRDVILGTTPAKMQTIQRKYYVPNNTALVVAGDVDPARVFALAQQVLGDWPRQGDPFVADPIPPIPALTKNEGVVKEAPVGAVTVMLQWQGPSVGKDPGATYAADVFSDVLNQPDSPLQRKLVDSGLFQAVGVNYYTLNQTGPITISGQTTPDKLRRALVALDAEIAHFGDSTYFSREALDASKASRAVSSAFGVERASGIAHTIGFWWSVASVDYFMGYVDNMGKQSLTDLTRYARKYILGKPRVVGVMISPEDRRALGLTEAELAGTKAIP
jgi:zinc protease